MCWNSCFSSINTRSLLQRMVCKNVHQILFLERGCIVTLFDAFWWLKNHSIFSSFCTSCKSTHDVMIVVSDSDHLPTWETAAIICFLEGRLKLFFPIDYITDFFQILYRKNFKNLFPHLFLVLLSATASFTIG